MEYVPLYPHVYKRMRVASLIVVESHHDTQTWAGLSLMFESQITITEEDCFTSDFNSPWQEERIDQMPATTMDELARWPWADPFGGAEHGLSQETLRGTFRGDVSFAVLVRSRARLGGAGLAP
jgi:hypothetical protein